MLDVAELKKYSVLFIDDEDLVRESLGAFLRRRFREVYLARDGVEGFEMYQKFNPDCVVSDIEMPRMNGVKLIEAIKQVKPDSCCIVVTAYKDEAHRSPLATHTLFKPVKKDDLLNLLLECLEKRFPKND